MGETLGEFVHAAIYSASLVVAKGARMLLSAFVEPKVYENAAHIQFFVDLSHRYPIYGVDFNMNANMARVMNRPEYTEKLMILSTLFVPRVCFELCLLPTLL